MASSTVENYLKAILSLRLERGDETLVPLKRIADRLEVTAGTVTSMMKHLSEEGLISYHARKGVALTEAGEKLSMLVLRKHRLIELFLVEIMGIDWADVHDDAEALEHVVSDRLIARIDEMLGFPARDPHGAPIPTAEGELPPSIATPLAECVPGEYRLIRVDEKSDGFLGWLKARNLMPGVALRLVAIDDIGEVAELAIAESSLQIGLSAARKLLVVPAGVAP